MGGGKKRLLLISIGVIRCNDSRRKEEKNICTVKGRSHRMRLCI